MKYLFRYLAATPRRLALYMIIAPVNAAVDVGLAYIMAIAIEFAIAGDLRQAGKYTLILICYILLSYITRNFRIKHRVVMPTSRETVTKEITVTNEGSK